MNQTTGGGRIHFFFDYLSPYSYIASELLRQSEDLRSLPLDYSPVVFGTILSHRGVKGPGEIPRQREVGLMDNLLLSQHHGIRFEAPPRHPFNPLYALRSTIAVTDPERRRALSQAYFELAWDEGRSLEDLEVLREGLARAGVDQDPEQAAADATNRRALKDLTRFAIDRGVTGLPTFLVDEDVLFFGGDRLELLLRYVRREITLDRRKLGELMARGGSTRVV